MFDPNATYKLAFEELREKLGRVPTANECLGIHDAYKRAWAPAEETVVAPTREAHHHSWQPTAGAYENGAPAAETCACGEMRLGGPRINAEPVTAESSPEPGNAPPTLSEGARGPGGGIVGKCAKCKGLFERPKSKGRPPAKCEGCR